MKPKRVNLQTLGCSKNLVDSEFLLKKLELAGFEVYHESPEQDFYAVIINTCGFIGDAKEESIEMILDYAREKEAGNIEKLIVFGCLSERYKEDLIHEIPEVDQFFGVFDLDKIIEYLGAEIKPSVERKLTTPAHYAYLKISEGCDRTCSFCAIPLIKGKHKSRTIKSLIEESEKLAKEGVKELILIAQDLSYYGIDLSKKILLPELINELSKINGIEWIRLHYLYPLNFSDELLELFDSNSKLCKYIDLPIQHISDDIVKGMRRGVSGTATKTLLGKIRKVNPEIAIRTTILTGFPGETEVHHNELTEFITSFKFDRLGVFQYSHEEDTYAHINLDDDVPDDVKNARADEIMSIQEKISFDLNQQKVGKTFKTIVDRREADYFIGRTEFDSPEVDNEILITADDLEIGQFYMIQIVDASEYDLFGEVV